MNCENIFCIYWHGQECTLTSISLDIQGRCIDCIYVNLGENHLKKLRSAAKLRQSAPPVNPPESLQPEP